MLKFNEYLKPSLVVSAIAAISLGLSSGSAFATGEFEEFDNERIVRVNCDKGRSVQRVLNRFANRTKPLEVIIKGNCIYEPDNEIQLERDDVSITGDEEIGAKIPFVVVDSARRVGIGGNLILTEGLGIFAGFVELGSDTYLTIENGITVDSRSLLRITTEAPDDEDDEEESSQAILDEEEPIAGVVTVNGLIRVINHSLLEIQREESGGMVFLNGTGDSSGADVIVSLQSSVDIKKATVGNIYLERDSHAAFNGDVIPVQDGFPKSISCDSESRVWQVVVDGIGDTADFTVELDQPLFLNSCLGN